MFLIVRKIYLFLYRIHVKLLWVIFPEVLMEYFDISGWHDAPVKIEVWLDEKTTWNVPITRVELWFHMVLQMTKFPQSLFHNFPLSNDITIWESRQQSLMQA